MKNEKLINMIKQFEINAEEGKKNLPEKLRKFQDEHKKRLENIRKALEEEALKDEQKNNS